VIPRRNSASTDATMNVDSLIERVKSILLDPDTEWPIIADEPATVAAIYKDYVLILAAIPAVFGFVKGSLIGIEVPMIGTIWIGIGAGIAGMIVSYALSIAQVYVIARIVDALAPTFAARPNPLQALKLSAYAFTAAWVAGLGQIVPWIGALIALAGGFYSIYLFYLGLPVLTKCPRDQAFSYTVVCIVVAIVLSFIVSHVVGSITGPTDPGHVKRSDIDYSKGSLGTVDNRAHTIEDAAKQAERAQKPVENAPASNDDD
jgi:hypothetical protein